MPHPSRFRDALVGRLAESHHAIHFPFKPWHTLTPEERMAWERDVYQFLDACDHAGIILIESEDR